MFLNKCLQNKILRQRSACPDREAGLIFSHLSCISSRGHHSGVRTAAKHIRSGYCWPSLYKYNNEFAKKFSQRQHNGGVLIRQALPLTPILVGELFNVCGINFMGPFFISFGHKYIFVVVYYVSKWVEDISLLNNEGKSVVKFWKCYIFARFGATREIISYRVSHFFNKCFSMALIIKGVKHKVATPYHPK